MLKADWILSDSFTSLGLSTVCPDPSAPINSTESSISSARGHESWWWVKGLCFWNWKYFLPVHTTTVEKDHPDIRTIDPGFRAICACRWFCSCCAVASSGDDEKSFSCTFSDRKAFTLVRPSCSIKYGKQEILSHCFPLLNVDDCCIAALLWRVCQQHATTWTTFAGLGRRNKRLLHVSVSDGWLEWGVEWPIVLQSVETSV